MATGGALSTGVHASPDFSARFTKAKVMLIIIGANESTGNAIPLPPSPRWLANLTCALINVVVVCLFFKCSFLHSKG